MNEEKFFNNESEFVDYLNYKDKNSELIIMFPGMLSFKYDPEQECGMTVQQGLFSYAVRACALKSLFERYGLSGSILERLSAEDRVNLLNEYAVKYAPNTTVQAPEVFGKISAFLSAGYTPYPENKLFELVNKEIEKLGISRFHGYWSYHQSMGVYHTEMTWTDPDGVKRSIIIRVRTSEIGESSVAFRVEFDTGKGYSVPMMTDHYIIHKNSGIADSVKAMVDSFETVIVEQSRKLGALMMVGISNPRNAAKRAAQFAKLPKRAILEILANTTFDENTSAFDIYYVLSQVIKKADAEKDRIRYGGDLAKLIRVNWEQFDLPGEYAW